MATATTITLEVIDDKTDLCVPVSFSISGFCTSAAQTAFTLPSQVLCLGAPGATSVV
jgi:hypothetical protein